MKTELKYGVVFAAIVIVYVMIEHLLGLNTNRHDLGQYTRLAGVLVPIVGIILGIKAKRDGELKGLLTFGQGVKTGFSNRSHSDNDYYLMVLDLWLTDQSRVHEQHAGVRAK